MSWQRANIQAAVTYLREHMKTDAASADARAKVIYEGLLEVLEPARRTIRLQREATEAAKASVPVAVTRERRQRVERRGHSERRLVNLGPPGGIERRKSTDRRAGADRRGRS
jgi:hypothetical protein